MPSQRELRDYIANLPHNRRPVRRANEGAEGRKPIGSARAKRAHLVVEKHDKYGKPYKGRNELLLSHGAYSAREAERELGRAADESAERVLGFAIETYGRDEAAEMDGNPRRSTASLTTWAGFGGAAWPPESPVLRRIQARREDSLGSESG